MLLGIDLGEGSGGFERLQQELVQMGMPYGLLLVGRLALREGRRESGRQVAACQDRLLAAGHTEAAGLLSTDLARWHLAHFRPRPALQAIGRIPETTWVLRWLRHLALAEIYITMDRTDFARTHAQRALAAPPRPMSPLLKSDLYLTMGRLFARSRLDLQAESALERAREVYTSAQDGARLGCYLIVRGELYWRVKDLESARQMFSRAIRILSQLGAGMLAREAELKLSLVLQGVHIDSIGS
jgi:tetratricopeptide (TPR) repeat protein